jgi:hypothetical protein
MSLGSWVSHTTQACRHCALYIHCFIWGERHHFGTTKRSACHWGRNDPLVFFLSYEESVTTLGLLRLHWWWWGHLHRRPPPHMMSWCHPSCTCHARWRTEWNQARRRMLSSFTSYALGAWRNLYKAFCNLKTSSCLATMKPGGCRTHTSSLSSSLRNVDLTSTWCTSQSSWAAMVSSI